MANKRITGQQPEGSFGFFRNIPKGYVSNKAYAENDQAFRARCDDAGVKPTARQASKFRAGKGSAFNAPKGSN